MKRLFITLFFFSASISFASADEPATERSFLFHYGAVINDVPAGSSVKVWFPVAQSNHHQSVELTKSMAPTKIQFHQDSTYKNQIGYFESTSSGSDLGFSADYRVVRQQVSSTGQPDPTSVKERSLFVQPSLLIPIQGRPQQVFKDLKLPKDQFESARTLYKTVDRHMSYDKSKPGYGNGDANWACDSRTGNCTDFHSLFISLARSHSLPAKFEIGFMLGSDPAGSVKGYHCWAWFDADKQGWRPVDISEADKHPEMKDYYFGNLTADRVVFSTGRDVKLVPESQQITVNYFVYPHVEVDGKVWPTSKVELDFSYEDFDSKN